MEVITLIKKGVDPNAGAVEPGAERWTVERMFDECMDDLRKRDCAERTMSDVLVRMNRYLADWKPIPISEITRSMAREKHRHISERHGKVVANSYSGLMMLAGRSNSWGSSDDSMKKRGQVRPRSECQSLHVQTGVVSVSQGELVSDDQKQRAPPRCRSHRQTSTDCLMSKNATPGYAPSHCRTYPGTRR